MDQQKSIDLELKGSIKKRELSAKMMRSPDNQRNSGVRVNSLFSNGMGCETTSKNEVGVQILKLRKQLSSPAS
jgi:hypothetical protein